MEPLLIILLVVVLAIGLRLVAGFMDSDRLEQYARERGWTVLERRWEPFGPGWFGQKGDRIYRVVYRDEQGRRHEAYAKTSALSGVYLTRDEVADSSEAPEGDPLRDLERENAELRARLSSLENEPGR